ncbi:GIY-YIG nuclease family protein [Paenibacillus albiflavus]|uniref:GIY-YIG nuclease family protein n=1 Tax=Paenibacillus albiflavus TaxID=2545760 RepID=A0A4R4EKQ1_9BACL|nr:GIY-YIG nuclease family protein [Paenibacillus albiflavus]TCZ79890.1 GIY-YIG nuclease family protein [Paenibacillus albiflavus]
MEQNKRKEMVAAYMEKKKPMGIMQIQNKSNGKRFIVSSVNLEGLMNRERFMLDMGNHANKELQKDWKELGPDQFTFEILDQIKPKEDQAMDRQGLKNVKDELTLLEQMWLDKLQPYGDQGYHIK